VDQVTTARLVGRRPEPADADAYVRFYGDPRTPEELSPSDLRTPDHGRVEHVGLPHVLYRLNG
jgi:hypothetical protein